MTSDALTAQSGIPALESGECLTREEFERRYHAMPECKKAELIDGIVYMPSPVRLKRHGQPHSRLMTWLGVYEAATPGVGSADNASMRVDLENEPQPDCMLFIAPGLGGQVQISNDDYILGGPELVAEITGSSTGLDRGPKLRLYRQQNVKEYLIWRVDDEVLDWYVLRHDSYELLKPDKNDILRSTVFPGLWLDSDALLRGKLAEVHAVLQQGLASDEHHSFVKQLQQQSS